MYNHNIFKQNQTANLTSNQISSQSNNNTLLKNPIKAQQEQQFQQQPLLQQQQSLPLQSQQSTSQQSQNLQQQKNPNNDKVIQLVAEVRTRVLYQLLSLNFLLEQNESVELSPVVGFLLIKNITNQTEYLKSYLQQQMQLQPENQAIQQLTNIIQSEIDIIFTCLLQYKSEVESLFQQNSSYLTLKKEYSVSNIDFESFRQTVVSFADSLRQYLSDNNSKAKDIKIAQMVNMILNCFLLEEYFGNQIDQNYNDFNNVSKTQDIQSLLGMIAHKTELSKQKQKPLDKRYLYS